MCVWSSLFSFLSLREEPTTAVAAAAVAHFNLVGKVRNAHARIDPFNKIMVSIKGIAGKKLVDRTDTMADVWL